MVDRDPFRFPQSNSYLLNYLAQADPTSPLAQPILPPLAGQTADPGTARAPTTQTASNAYAMHRALEQQIMARVLQNALPPQDSAPLAGEPGLQFDDAHMTLDPNQLAQQFGLT